MKELFLGLNKAAHVMYAALALAFALTLPFSAWVQWRYDNLQIYLLFCIPLAIILYLIMVVLSYVARRYQIGVSSAADTTPRAYRRLWLSIGTLFLFSWGITFLMNYPGICSVDSNGTIRQLIGELPLQNDISLTFTLFVGVFFLPGYAIGGLEMGVALYSVAQLILMVTVCSWCVVWLYRKGAPVWLLVIVSGFFALNPYIAHYAITIWKDVPFSILMLLLVMNLYDLVTERPALSFRRLAIICLLCLLILFFRKNALLAVIPTLIWVVALFAGQRVKLTSIFTLVVATSLIIQGPLFAAFGIRPSPLVEALAIPLQQVGAVVHNGEELTPEQEELISSFIPLERLAEIYNNASVDWIKFDDRFDRAVFAERGPEFLVTWLEMAPDHLTTYLRAWGGQTIGYWDIGTENWVIPANTTAFGAPTHNLLQVATGLEFLETNQVESDRQYDVIRHFPLLYPLFNIASMLWLTLIACALLVVNRKGTQVLVLLPLVGLWLSILLSAPTFCEFRYMFAFHLCLPITLVLPFLGRPIRPADAVQKGIGEQSR